MKAFTVLRTLVAIGTLSALAPASFAQALTGDVTVTVALASKCRVDPDGSTPVVDFGTYTAFGGAKVGTTGDVTFECTRGFGGTPVAAWDTAGGTATGIGVIAGLQYTLKVTTSGRTAGTDADTTTVGTGDIVKYTVGGDMPAGQAGAGAGGAAVTATRTLMVTF
jgi:hypothetical protein